MLRVVTAIALLLGACGTEDVSPQREPPEEQWVCYNPTSEYHGYPCNDQCYWVGQQKVENSFCWLLQKSDCVPPLELEWQRENCHLFEGAY